jgi:hypothetical protein
MKKPLRRPILGRPLLIAGTGASVLIACSGIKATGDTEVYTSGNLVAPPMVQLCIEVSPPEADATVTASGQTMPEAEPSCVQVYEGSIQLTASAEGYAPYEETLEVYVDTNHTITLDSGE